MPDRRRPASLLLSLLMMAAPACASLQERLTAAENRTAALEAQVADLQASQQNIITRLSQIRQDLENALDPLRTQQANRGEDIRALEAEVNALRQQLLLLSERITQLTEEIASRPTTAGPVGSPMPPQTTPRGQPPDRQPAGQAADKSGAQAIFDTAYLDYLRGSYVLAIDGFEEYLRRYGSSDRADDALYWIGECLAAQGDHADARSRFLEILRRYPDADKVPDAMLRAALESIELGRPREASQELRQLIAAHPNTDPALIACMQLDRLGERLPPGCPSTATPPGLANLRDLPGVAVSMGW